MGTVEVTRLIAVAVLAATLVACGPRPSVESASASSVQDSKTTVAVALRNGGGEGSVRLTVTVKEKSSGRVVGREEVSVPLKGGERMTVAVEVPVPEGVSEVEAEAEAKYPPD